MATITKYKLNGIEYEPPREWKGVEILATFQGENQKGGMSESVQANITTSEFSFVNEAKQAIDSWFSSYPTEGMPLSVSISNETNSYGAFNGYLDFRTAQYMSDVESKYGIKQDNGLTSLDNRLRGISMLLLEQKGFIVNSDFSNIPYIIENRKTDLEKLYLLFQVFNLIKTGADEVHKLINIASDITSAGIVQALINLTVTITALILIIQQLVNLFNQIRDTFFPPVRYHRGISLYTAIQKAVAYCGYSLVTIDPFTQILQKTHLCPSKNDEIGETNTSSTESGILKPNNFGYIASDLFSLANMLYFTKVAIVGTNVVIMPFNAPYWTQSPSYVLPNMKVEQAFVKNGSRSINYDELMSSRILQYSTDDSDLWTLTNVNDQISVTTVTPINVINQNRVLLTGSEQITIPYSLAVRKDPIDELLDLFLGTAQGMEQLKQLIETRFNEVATILGTSFPALANFTAVITNRTGCMKVENHFFSNPKIVYLEDNNRIPDNYVDIVGAIALNNNYHSYKSFVAGVRDPSNPGNTNCKDVYTDVTIPMGIDDFNTLIGNSFFLTQSGILGKFTSIKWLPDKDRAVCSYYIQGNWAVNLEENTV